MAVTLTREASITLPRPAAETTTAAGVDTKARPQPPL